MRMALPAPKSRTSPYMPDSTYATASPIVINTPSNFWAPFLHHHNIIATFHNHNQKPNIIKRSNTQTKTKPNYTSIIRDTNKSSLSIHYRKKEDKNTKTSRRKHRAITYRRARSSLTLLSTSMSFDPANSCITRPDVTIGVIPSSITVPRLDARMTRIQ